MIRHAIVVIIIIIIIIFFCLLCSDFRFIRRKNEIRSKGKLLQNETIDKTSRSKYSHNGYASKKKRILNV
jgi:hypothetical protein